MERARDNGDSPGASGFFSWPSKGNIKGCPADEASIEASEHAIADFLIDFSACCAWCSTRTLATPARATDPLPAMRRCDGDHRGAGARDQPSARLRPSTQAN
jgi:hypothetical protein